MRTQLIEEHLEWLEGHQAASERTLEARRRILHVADANLPDGLGEASAAELARHLKQWKGWTRRNYDQHIRGFYRWATWAGRLAFDPMEEIPPVRVGPPVPQACEDEEVALALTAPALPWRRAVVLAAYAGLRCAEICTVHADDIAGDRLRVYGKGRKYRTVPINDQLRAELGPRPTGLLCTAARGTQLNPRVLTQWQRQIWRRLGLREEFHLHGLRHWFATRLVENGVDVRVVQELLGHESLATTMGYLRVADQRKHDAVRQLPAIGSLSRGLAGSGPIAA